MSAKKASPTVAPPSPRFAIGIDLGTTHCALSYSVLGAGDPRQTPAVPEVFAVPQVVHPSSVEARPLLPSFLYLPQGSEFPERALQLPWMAKNESATFVVGELARSQGALTPVRLVSSAKSWLCHPGIDRRAASLPVGSPDEVPKVSPLEASARYLAHLRAAWNATIAHDDPSQALEHQDVTLTVPASFDAVARELTVEAARLAGLGEPTLLEEPQAALYAWVRGHGEGWRKLVTPGDLILVVDVGGGTTDFSLIAVVDRAGDFGLERVAVGEHILLGGDNMDLALAHVLQEKLKAAGKALDRWQFQALTHAVRQAKELLFNETKREKAPITVPGRGSSLMGGALRTELTRIELTGVLVDGFFPRVAALARPVASKRIGLTSLGLPYASDAAVTRHLAAFLGRQQGTLESASTSYLELRGKAFPHPSVVLFNGGVMKAKELKDRVLEVLSSWVVADGGRAPRELPGSDLDLAVARGAACFGEVRHGRGIRIRGGTARAHYVGIETAAPAVPGMPPPLRALCVAPMGMEEGTRAALSAELGLVVGEAAHFRIFASAIRRDDRVGTIVDDWEELEELPIVETTLSAEGVLPGQVVPVNLRAHVTEIGTLELECVEKTGKAWKLEFNLRAGTEGARDAAP